MTTQAITKADMIGIRDLSISNAELEDFNSISLMVQNEVTRSLLGDDLFNDFTTDFDGQSFNDYDSEVANELLKQEKFDDYVLVNIVGGKSWKINQYYVGFFATINNALDQEYITGGFEQGRKSNYRDLKEDRSRENGSVFGSRYFFGTGASYYVNVYVRF